MSICYVWPESGSWSLSPQGSLAAEALPQLESTPQTQAASSQHPSTSEKKRMPKQMKATRDAAAGISQQALGRQASAVVSWERCHSDCCTTIPTSTALPSWPGMWRPMRMFPGSCARRRLRACMTPCSSAAAGGAGSAPLRPLRMRGAAMGTDSVASCATSSRCFRGAVVYRWSGGPVCAGGCRGGAEGGSAGGETSASVAVAGAGSVGGGSSATSSADGMRATGPGISVYCKTKSCRMQPLVQRDSRITVNKYRKHSAAQQHTHTEKFNTQRRF